MISSSASATVAEIDMDVKVIVTDAVVCAVYLMKLQRDNFLFPPLTFKCTCYKCFSFIAATVQ